MVECGIAVIGGGPAGVAAAAVAAGLGRDVVLVDSSPRAGGQIWRHRDLTELPARGRRWVARLGASGARTIFGTTVVDAWVDGVGIRIVGERDGEALTLRADQVILATGARELFLPFPGWTLPNIFGVGGAQALLRAGLSFAGKRVVIAGSGPLLLAVAASLRGAGAEVVAIAEQADRGALLRFGAGLWRSPARIAQAAGLRASLGRVRYLTGTWVRAARGDGRVQEVELTDGRRSWTERCDVLCTGYGLVPNTELAELLGCDVVGGRVRVDGSQRTSRDRVYCAGEPTGIAGVEAALVEGEIAGRAACGAAIPVRLFARRRREREFAERLDATFSPRAELCAPPPPGTVICRCEDVTIEMLDPEWSFRQAKLYTRIGMGPCQARVCGPAHRCLFGEGTIAGRVPALPAAVTTLIAGAPPRDP